MRDLPMEIHSPTAALKGLLRVEDPIVGGEGFGSGLDRGDGTKRSTAVFISAAMCRLDLPLQPT